MSNINLLLRYQISNKHAENHKIVNLTITLDTIDLPCIECAFKGTCTHG